MAGFRSKNLETNTEADDKRFIVSDYQLRRLLRLSNVDAYHDCRTMEVPEELLTMIMSGQKESKAK
jgi:hypothetical protein